MAQRKNSKDVKWTVPNTKKPLCYSTEATSHLIVALMEPSDTIQMLRNKIVYDVEAKEVLNMYIKVGYGNQIASEWFH